MTPPIVTAFYAGLATLFFLWQASVVINHRRSKKIVHGDGGEKAVARAIRGHANTAETLPIALILLALTELFGAPAVVLHALGAAIVAGRVAHGLHFAGVVSHQARPIGMLLTLIPTTLMAIGLIGHSLMAMG